MMLTESRVRELAKEFVKGAAWGDQDYESMTSEDVEAALEEMLVEFWQKLKEKD